MKGFVDEMVLLYLLSGASDRDWYHPYFGIRKYQFDGIDLGYGRAVDVKLEVKKMIYRNKNIHKLVRIDA